MDYRNIDTVLTTASTSSVPPNTEADSGYEQSPSSTVGQNTMFNFEDDSSCSDPADIPNFNFEFPSDEESDNYNDPLSGRARSSPIPIPFSSTEVLLSRSTPGLGYTLNHSPFRRLSCPQVLQSGLRVMRNAATQTPTNEGIPSGNSNGSEEPRQLLPIRAPLPDVVQHDGFRPGHVERVRSASVSLPVGSTQCTEVGRTLRRLSDEFERGRSRGFSFSYWRT